MADVGLTLMPDREWLALMSPLLDDCDYAELAPETLWMDDGKGLRPNGFHAMFAALHDSGLPTVAHGVGWSLGNDIPGDEERRALWLERIAHDHATFGFRWYSDHLAMTTLAGEHLRLPLPMPLTPYATEVVRRHLDALQAIVPDVAVENTVTYVMLGTWAQEAQLAAQLATQSNTWLVLDLHNLMVMAHNLGLSEKEWLAHVDLSRVIEIHMSGGAEAPPSWSLGKPLRLDSHCSAIPDTVWALLDEVGPRCTNLRGVTLERMEGTVTAEDVPLLHAELHRLRETVRPW